MMLLAWSLSAKLGDSGWLLGSDCELELGAAPRAGGRRLG